MRQLRVATTTSQGRVMWHGYGDECMDFMWLYALNTNDRWEHDEAGGSLCGFYNPPTLGQTAARNALVAMWYTAWTLFQDMMQGVPISRVAVEP